MSPLPLLKGFIIGFSVAAPVGPMGVLCIQRSLERGRLAGFLTGLGIAAADALYASVAAFGLTFILDRLMPVEAVVELAGGLFLLYLGIRVFLSRPSDFSPREKGLGLAAIFGTSFLLTLANPPTILSFMALFAALGEAGRMGGNFSPALLVAGVFAGSIFWWLILSQGVSLTRSKMGPLLWGWVNRASGAVIAGFGALALLHFIKDKL